MVSSQTANTEKRDTFEMIFSVPPSIVSSHARKIIIQKQTHYILYKQWSILKERQTLHRMPCAFDDLNDIFVEQLNKLD